MVFTLFSGLVLIDSALVEINWLRVFSYLSLLLSCISIFLNIFLFKKNSSIHIGKNKVLSYTSWLAFIIAILISLIIYNHFEASILVGLEVSLLLLSVGFISLLILFRYPEYAYDFEEYMSREDGNNFLNSIHKGEEQSSKTPKLLEKMDVVRIRSELTSLMENEKLYLNEELTLRALSKKLSLTPHQLSEFLNRELGKNFSNFVNEYRIKQAKEILADEPNLSVIRTAYMVGFSSKSAYYSALKKMA